MTRYFLLSVPALMSLAAVTDVLAADAPLARRHRHYHHAHYVPNPFAANISYDHNYGPGPYLGTFAYYDGPLRANCKQSAAAYRGQDGRRHPCN